MFGMGFGELLVVLVIVLLVFGPGRLPEMMGSLGKRLQEFKKGLREPPEIEKAPESDDPDSTRRGRTATKLPPAAARSRARRAEACDLSSGQGRS